MNVEAVDLARVMIGVDSLDLLVDESHLGGDIVEAGGVRQLILGGNANLGE